jgi:hypothetical protein
VSYTDNYDQPIDPVEAAIEATQYQDSHTAAEKLVGAFDAMHTERERRDRRPAELRRSGANIKQFERENPAFANDRVVAAAVRERVIAEQEADLERVGVLDRQKFLETYKRQPNQGEIAEAHLDWRANGPSARFAPRTKSFERLETM